MVLFIMNKIIKININDILIDPAGESEMITKACSRNHKMNVTGLAQVNDIIIVVCENSKTDLLKKYVLAPMESLNIDEIETEISTRFFSGFSFIGSFLLKSKIWALYSIPQKL